MHSQAHTQAQAEERMRGSLRSSTHTRRMERERARARREARGAQKVTQASRASPCSLLDRLSEVGWRWPLTEAQSTRLSHGRRFWAHGCFLFFFFSFFFPVASVP